jgi:ABC-2 type transport system permease protein
MLLRNPYLKALRDGRRGLIGWAVAIGAVALLYSVYYPAVSQPAMANAIKAYPETLKNAFGMQDLATPAGYLESTIFGLLVPVLVAVYTIVTGSRTVAGDEESGVLDLVLAHPVGRTRLLLARLGALWTGVVVISAVVLVLVYAVSGPAKLSSIGFGHLAAAAVQLALFGTCIGTLTLGVGAATGRRSSAIATGTVVAVLGYFANNLGPQVHALAWTQRLSPFYYDLAGKPLVNGLQVADGAVLLGAALVFAVLAAVAFDRRDIAV